MTSREQRPSRAAQFGTRGAPGRSVKWWVDLEAEQTRRPSVDRESVAS